MQGLGAQFIDVAALIASVERCSHDPGVAEDAQMASEECRGDVELRCELACAHPPLCQGLDHSTPRTVLEGGQRCPDGSTHFDEGAPKYQRWPSGSTARYVRYP